MVSYGSEDKYYYIELPTSSNIGDTIWAVAHSTAHTDKGIYVMSHSGVYLNNYSISGVNTTGNNEKGAKLLNPDNGCLGTFVLYHISGYKHYWSSM